MSDVKGTGRSWARGIASARKRALDLFTVIERGQNECYEVVFRAGAGSRLDGASYCLSNV